MEPNDETDPPVPPQCDDGSDNDGDNKIDYPDDPGCYAKGDDDERDPLIPPQCSDTIDNDLDQTHDLIINENDNPDCAADISFDNPCFSEPLECTINEINVNAYEEDQSVTIDITISKEGDCSTQFNVWLNDVLLGLYEIPDNTLQITGVESSDEMLRVTVCNVNNEESCGEDEVSNPLITSVNELENNTLFFWDNHQISISNNNTFTINVAIMNINGKLLDEETLNPLTDWNKSLQSYTTGIYLISIQSKDRIKTYKIFK